ncbi:MAG: serine/threonine protein kinase [Deferrisomatales bacterium]|nr:serine/threonine protein kinase [Deferrisomatales bacterium]
MKGRVTREDGAGEALGVPYAGLTPERVLDAVEGAGYRCDGRLLALNSYENRVYQVGLEDGEPLVAKFYRPGRWSDEAIREEHAFSEELAEEEIPAVPPLGDRTGETLHAFEGFRFALYPRRPGRSPELEDAETLRWLGRFLGRLHAVGARRPFRKRPALDPETFGDEPLRYLLGSRLLPGYLAESYRAVALAVMAGVRRCYERAGPVVVIRLHGDCHAGNVLWTREGPHFVDFDDSRNGPAVQDLWMLLSGDGPALAEQLGWVLEGYGVFRDFDPRELHLIEALRALRMMHHSAWLARRWDDPAFPAAFPWFGEPRYWEGQILALREQAALLDEPPVRVDP